MTKAAELAKMGEVLTNSQIGGRRNIIINGGMQVAQRGTSFTGKTADSFIVDRFTMFVNGAMGTWTTAQSTTVPTGEGFVNSIKMDCTTADASPASSDILSVQQRFEGQDLQQLKKGTSSAESLTATFYVRSNKTGTYIAELEDRDNTRYVSQSYTISSADTWEKKTVTFPSDTSGALNNDNGESLRLNFWLGGGSDFTSGTLGTTWHTTATNRAVGQVNLADSTSNEWYVTGVQLEVGEQATPFEHRSFGEELALCQRYCVQIVNTENASAHIILAGMSRGSTNKNFTLPLPVTMRNTTPSVTLTGDVRLLNPEAHDYVNATDTLTCGGVTPTLVYMGNMLGLLYTGSVTDVTDTGNADYNFQIVSASDHSFIIDSEL
jgi:hypothetical protein